MLYKQKAIILHTIKHRDSSLIVYAYTSKFGRQTYIVNGIFTQKSKTRTLFQPLYLLDVEAYNNQKSEIQRIKEYKLSEPLVSIPFDIRKSSVAMFIAEVLYKIVREEEPNSALFDFIYNSVLLFDKMEGNFANFHLHFLANLSKFLGFYPDSPTESYGFFDIKSGSITAVAPKHTLWFSRENTQILQRLLSIQASDVAQINLNRENREMFLNEMLKFYNYHFEKLSPINSLKIFKEVFTE